MGTTVGRLYFYTVSLISLLAAAYGAGSLLATLGKLVLETGTAVTGDVAFWRTTLSTYLPLLIVGGGIWTVHWLAMRRRVDQMPSEQQATLRKLFLNVVLLITAGAALFNATRFLYHLLGVITSSSLPLIPGRSTPQDIYNGAVWLLVYGLLWYYYWRIEAEEGSATATGRTLQRWQLYLLSLGSLGLLIAGVYYSLSIIVARVIGSQGAQVLGDDLGKTISIWSLSLAPIIAGAGWWTFHWRYAAGQDRQSVLRQVYLYFWTLFGVAGAVTALGILLYQGLRYLFGFRDISTSAQLGFLTNAVPLLAVSAACWAYHRTVAHEEVPEAGTPAMVRRRYNYLVAGLGLAATVFGLANLIRILLEMALQVGTEIGQAPNWWRDQLSGFIAMAVVGVGVWLPHWWSIQGSVAESAAGTLRALSRRVFLYVVLFVGVVTVLFNTAAFLGGLLRLVLGEPTNARFLGDLFTNLSNVLIVGLFFFYHWRVLQQDRLAITELPADVVKAVTILAAERFLPRVNQLQQALGTKVSVLNELPSANGATEEPLSEDFSPAELEELVDQVRKSAGEKVLVMFTPQAVEVHPYR